MGVLLAGVGRSDITPAPGTPHGGWGAQTHQRGLGADMPLYATALVISDTVRSVAVIDADAIGFDLQWTNKILDTVVTLSGLPREHIRFSCTHTHSGPNTFRLQTITEGLDMALGYLEELPRRISGAVWQAQQDLKPVRCAAGKGRCDINVNRRLKLDDGRVVVGKNWDGPVDHTVRVCRASAETRLSASSDIDFGVVCHKLPPSSVRIGLCWEATRAPGDRSTVHPLV
jgi:neutral ceramidase